MGSFNPYGQYQTAKYVTADQGALILMSYDAAIRFCRAGRDAIAAGDATVKGRMLTRAFDVIAELRQSLRPDPAGEVAKHLDEAYAFAGRQITLGNVMNDAGAVDNALRILEALRAAWAVIIQRERSGTVPVTGEI